jgi:translin
MEIDLQSLYHKLQIKEEKRERLLAYTRELIRISARCVKKIHQGDIERAKELIEEATDLNLKITEFKDEIPEIYFPITFIGQQEYTEAASFLSIVTERRLPDYNTLHVEVEPYLTGLADMAGELKRYVIHLLKEGDLNKAEQYLDILDSIFDELMMFDFPEKMIPGLRKKMDGVRTMLDRVKTHMLITSEIRHLMEALNPEKGRDK